MLNICINPFLNGSKQHILQISTKDKQHFTWIMLIDSRVAPSFIPIKRTWNSIVKRDWMTTKIANSILHMSEYKTLFWPTHTIKDIYGLLVQCKSMNKQRRGGYFVNYLKAFTMKGLVVSCSSKLLSIMLQCSTTSC